MNLFDTSFMLGVMALLIVALITGIIALRKARTVIDDLRFRIENTTILLRSDDRWLASDEMAQMFIQRYNNALSEQWAEITHYDSGHFRGKQVEPLYRAGWNRFDHLEKKMVREISAVHNPHKGILE